MMLEDESEEFVEKRSTKDYLIEYSWLIVAGLFILILRGRWGIIGPLDKATTVGLGFVVFVSFVKLTYSAWKNATPKIIYNYGHNITDGEIIPAGNFGIMRPAIKAYQWYFKLPGAYVAPLDSLHKAGPNILINAKMDISSLDEMPIEVRSVIVEKDIKPPYYLGFADEEQYGTILDKVATDPEAIQALGGITRPNVSYLVDEIKKVNKQVALREKILSGDLTVIEDFVKGAGRIQSRAKGDIWEILKKGITEEE